MESMKRNLIEKMIYESLIKSTILVNTSFSLTRDRKEVMNKIYTDIQDCRIYTLKCLEKEYYRITCTYNGMIHRRNYSYIRNPVYWENMNEGYRLIHPDFDHVVLYFMKNKWNCKILEYMKIFKIIDDKYEYTNIPQAELYMHNIESKLYPYIY